MVYSSKFLSCWLGGRGGGVGTFSTFRGTCHSIGVLFSNRYGIVGIIFTIFRPFTELWVSFSGDFFIIFESMAQIPIAELWP